MFHICNASEIEPEALLADFRLNDSGDRLAPFKLRILARCATGLLFQ